MKYFLKELVSKPLKLSTGNTIEFEDVGGDMGVIATDNGFLVGELEKAHENRVGGVVPIDQEQYDDLKKNAVPGDRSAPRLKHVVEALLRAESQDQAVLRSLEEERRSANAAADNTPEGNPMVTGGEVIEKGEPLKVPDAIPTATPAAKVEGTGAVSPPITQPEQESDPEPQSAYVPEGKGQTPVEVDPSLDDEEEEGTEDRKQSFLNRIEEGQQRPIDPPGFNI